MAVADANPQFIYVDVGACGYQSDGGILSNSTLGKAVAAGKLGLPDDEPLEKAPQLGRMLCFLRCLTSHIKSTLCFTVIWLWSGCLGFQGEQLRTLLRI